MIWDSGTTDLSAYKGENDELVFPSVSPATSTKLELGVKSTSSVSL